MIRVHGFRASINVRKVLWTLAEIGEDFALEPVGAGGLATSDPAFRTLNPFGLVPVIEDGAVILRESNTIVRYLAASRGRTDLLPADAAARARVETWMDWQASDLNASWKPAFHALMRGHVASPEAIAASEAAWTRNIGLLDAHLSTSRYVAGEAFTVADVCVGLSLHRWLGTPVTHPAFPHCTRYHAAIKARPAFAEGIEGGP